MTTARNAVHPSFALDRVLVPGTAPSPDVDFGSSKREQLTAATSVSNERDILQKAKQAHSEVFE
jgi:hypothetical protein